MSLQQAADILSTEHQRELMVTWQVKERGIDEPAVLRALREVPRELFLPPELVRFAYDDGPLPIAEGQTVSQPFVVAMMAAAVAVGPADRVLEVGAGSGYSAAVLSRIAGEVHSVERIRSLADHSASCLRRLGYDNVHVHHADGYSGWPSAAPYAGIVVTAAAPRIPEPLLQQLAPGGRLVAPVGGTNGAQDLYLVHRSTVGELTRELLSGVRFVPMVEGIRH